MEELLYPALGAAVSLLATGYIKKWLEREKERYDQERSLRDELRLEIDRLRASYSALSARLDTVELELKERDKLIEAGRVEYFDLLHLHRTLQLAYERIRAIAREAYVRLGGDMPDELEMVITPIEPATVFERRK